MNEFAPHNEKIELVAIVNSFNRRPLLQKAIESLTRALRTAPFGSAIIVFDAGSTDGSKEFLETWRNQNPADNLIILNPASDEIVGEADSFPNKQPNSFSDGVNAGCAAALAQFPDSEWLFLYETDNWIADVDPLLQAISLLKAHPQLGAAGFTVRLHSGQPCGYGMRFPSYHSLVLGQNLTARWDLLRPNDSPWEETQGIRWRLCDVVFTSPLLIRRTAWERTAGLDAKSFPFSDSDVDWAWRAAKLGWKMAVVATDGVLHDNLQQTSAWSANRVIDFHKSRLRVLKRHRGASAELLKPLLFGRHAIEAAILASRSRHDPNAKQKFAKRKQMLRSVWQGYT